MVLNKFDVLQSDDTWFIQANLNISYSFGDVEMKVDAQFVN